MKKFLVRHVGNMGDMVFLIPPALEMLKKKHPGCHITFVTAWGFKKRKRVFPYISKKDIWGERNQSGFCISLMMTNPHVDQLVHFSTHDLSLEGDICKEEGVSFPTWSQEYYESQKNSGSYDEVFELDVGLSHHENPLDRIYSIVGLEGETFSNYKIYLSKSDLQVAAEVMKDAPSPRIVLLESLAGITTRNWDPEKATELESEIVKTYNVPARWFGGGFVPRYNGRPLTLRENIATLTYCDIGIGVLSGPLHFAAAVGLPTITLYGDHTIERTAPAYFLNPYISDPAKQHRTLLAPTDYSNITLLKDDSTLTQLTSTEIARQNYQNWQEPGLQSKKSSLAVVTVEEVMSVLTDALPAA